MGTYRIDSKDGTPQLVQPRASLSGMGGWLLFFIIAQFIVAVVLLAIGVLYFLSPVPLFWGVLFSLIGVLCLLQPIGLIWKIQGAVRYTQAFIILSTVAMFLLELVMLIKQTPVGSDPLAPEAVGSLMGSYLPAALGCWIWFSYFAKSRRVRNTYTDQEWWKKELPPEEVEPAREEMEDRRRKLYRQNVKKKRGDILIPVPKFMQPREK